MSKFIVTTSLGRWGTGATLLEACENARLDEERPADRVCDLIEYFITIEQTSIDWAEVEQSAKPIPLSEYDPVEIAVFYFDPEHWEDYRICQLTGAVTFEGFKGDPDQSQASFDRSSFAATWHCGRITHRNPNARAA